jgi:putative thioredoxin
VRGIPAVKGFSGGRPVAEFTGAIPEPQVKQWLEQLGPSKGEVLTAEAGRAESSGDLDTASSLYEEALSIEPTHAEAAAGLARVRLAIRQYSLDETSISQRLAEDESDLDAVLGMADIEVGRGDHADAFQRLVDFITISAGDEKEAARQHLLGLLDTLPADDPQVLQARRSLGAALF